ncbi:MAG: urease accessory protein UreD [Inquilinus limosus]|uniref:Urease accessory protein UreD n=1 Tax=Inquilinus limosus TaxID=171674 RepID=A0A952FFE8_9PROT|nr:urease accessory protein UreD [Inquilinus limosus]
MKTASVVTLRSDPPALAEPTALPVPLARARGRLDLGFKRRGVETVLDALFQEGCAKARFPRREAGAFAGAVLLNTAGGLTGGDRLSQAVRWGEGTAATVAGQAAERIYRSLGDAAQIETRLTVEPGAVAEWLPQETILFDRARLDRDLRIELRGDARFLGVEAIVFGRAAMGETVRQGTLGAGVDRPVARGAGRGAGSGRRQRLEWPSGCPLRRAGRCRAAAGSHLGARYPAGRTPAAARLAMLKKHREDTP